MSSTPTTAAAMVPSSADADASVRPTAGPGGAKAGSSTRRWPPGRDELLDENRELRAQLAELVQLRERHERQQSELHAQSQELISLRRDVERVQRDLGRLVESLEIVAREVARLSTGGRRRR